MASGDNAYTILNLPGRFSVDQPIIDAKGLTVFNQCLENNFYNNKKLTYRLATFVGEMPRRGDRIISGVRENSAWGMRM